MVLVNHRGWKILPFICAYRLSIYQVKQCTTQKSTSGLKIRNLKVKKSTKEKLSTRVEIEWGKITSEVWSFFLYGLIRDFFWQFLIMRWYACFTTHVSGALARFARSHWKVGWHHTYFWSAELIIVLLENFSVSLCWYACISMHVSGVSLG